VGTAGWITADGLGSWAGSEADTSGGMEVGSMVGAAPAGTPNSLREREARERGAVWQAARASSRKIRTRKERGVRLMAQAERSG